jgi:predicted Zn finger-like uncharacterized protein
MDIVCPHCETSYRVTPESLGQSGRSVRCVTCHNVWFEEPRQPAFQADEPSYAAAAPSMIRPLDDVVEIGLTASSRPVWDQPLDDTDAFDNAKDESFDSGTRHDTEFSDGLRMQAGPSIIPPEDPKSDFNGGQDVESLAARRMAKRRPARPRFGLKPSLPAAICTMLIVIAGLVVARHQVVRILPQTASLYAAIGLPVNLRGLVFDSVKTVRETEDGQPMLVVEGNIIGTNGRLTEVPLLRFGVIDSAGKEIYAWTARPNRALLPPGEILNFRSRLASPPADASSITVRFFNRRDAQTELM